MPRAPSSREPRLSSWATPSVSSSCWAWRSGRRPSGAWSPVASSSWTEGPHSIRYARTSAPGCLSGTPSTSSAFSILRRMGCTWPPRPRAGRRRRTPPPGRCARCGWRTSSISRTRSQRATTCSAARCTSSSPCRTGTWTPRRQWPSWPRRRWPGTRRGVPSLVPRRRARPYGTFRATRTGSVGPPRVARCTSLTRTTQA
mmetsp:Transcript_75149/g.199588  ORF Transcript_75149/g.199588 Transcript_75149/m.199588 type:complete len:200 (-) Transcript_75149:113-712(-)